MSGAYIQCSSSSFIPPLRGLSRIGEQVQGGEFKVSNFAEASSFLWYSIGINNGDKGEEKEEEEEKQKASIRSRVIPLSLSLSLLSLHRYRSPFLFPLILAAERDGCETRPVGRRGQILFR